MRKQFTKDGSATEASIQTAILEVLQFCQNRGRLYYIRNQSGAIKLPDGRYIKMGRKGTSDIIVFFKGGTTEFWEVKRQLSGLTKDQEDFQKQIEGLGFIFRVVHSADEAKGLLGFN